MVHNNHHGRAVLPHHVHVVGFSIGDFSRHILREGAGEAKLSIMHVTSVRRTVQDQARIFFQKHVVEGKAAEYRNSAVEGIIKHAGQLWKKGQSDDSIKARLNMCMVDRYRYHDISDHVRFLKYLTWLTTAARRRAVGHLRIHQSPAGGRPQYRSAR
jgi:hypothetical protein